MRNSISLISSVVLSGILFSLFVPIAYAAVGVPKIINYQGRLMDSSQNLLGGAGTNYCFKFSLYDNAVVGAGAKLWPTGTPTTMTIAVKSGVFNVGIGDVSAGGDTLDYNFQDSDTVYLDVQVATKVGATCAPGDGAEVFEDLGPRNRLYAASYAINASTIGGFLAAQYATGSQIPVLASGNLVLGGTNPFINATTTNTLTFQGGGLPTGDIQFFNSSNKITASGNLNMSAGVFAAALASFGNMTIGSTATTTLQGTITGTSTIQGFINVLGTNSTSTFSGGLATTYLNLTGSSATSTAANGFAIAGGCFSVRGSCVVSNISAADGTVTVNGNNGVSTVALNLANANIWSGLQQFGNASTTLLESMTQFARIIQSTSTNALVLKSNFSSTAGLTFGSTSTPQVLAIDTISNRVRYGTGAGVANPILAVFDTGNGADPVGANGAIYYNSNLSSFRCFNSTWVTCGGGAASSTGDVQFKNVDGSFTATANMNWSLANNGLTIKGNAGQAGDLFVVASSSGAILFDITNSGALELSTSSTPSIPAAGQLDIFARDIAGRTFLAMEDTNGLSTSLQPLLARNKIGYWNPPGNSTTIPGVFGFTSPTVVGTATARNVATTNFATRLRRLGYVSTAVAGNFAEQRVSVAQYTVGGAGQGGFTMIARFVPSDAAAVTGERFFIGMSSSIVNAANVEPSTLTNTIGLAQLSSSNNLQIVYGGSVAQTPIDLGAGFPANTLSTEAYELALFSSPNSSTAVGYVVTRLSTGASITGTLTGVAGTALPSNATLLTYRAWKTNNATALAVAFDIASVYIETDN